jgi:hypothetical protein
MILFYDIIHANTSQFQIHIIVKVAETLGNVLNRPSIFRVPKMALEVAFGEAAKPITDSIRMEPKALQKAGFTFRYESLEEALADITGG